MSKDRAQNDSKTPVMKPNSEQSANLLQNRLLCAVFCLLGFHRWVNIDETPMPNPKAGEMICWSELHQCSRCGKQEYKGMGCVI